MPFSVLFSISAILIMSFVVTKKKLHLFEIAFIWMVVLIIDHNFFTITALNLGMLDISKAPEDYWSLSLLRIVIIPVLIVWYFDKTLSEKPYKKWAWLPVGILTLVGVEYLSDALYVFTHRRWNYGWSFVEWFTIFLLVNYAWIWYRSLLRKEMQ